MIFRIHFNMQICWSIVIIDDQSFITVLIIIIVEIFFLHTIFEETVIRF